MDSGIVLLPGLVAGCWLARPSVKTMAGGIVLLPACLPRSLLAGPAGHENDGRWHRFGFWPGHL